MVKIVKKLSDEELVVVLETIGIYFSEEYPATAEIIFAAADRIAEINGFVKMEDKE
jgi:hypothetical protein